MTTVRVLLEQEPSRLFLSFVDMNLSVGHLSLVAVVFVACSVGLALAWALIRRLYPGDRFTPFLAGGYEFGMLGVSLFVGAYGAGASCGPRGPLPRQEHQASGL